MTTEHTPAPAPAAAVDHADRVGHWLILVGTLLHSVGGKILRSRNEQLGDEAAEMRRRADALADAHQTALDNLDRAYQLGREHERDGVPGAAAADVDEHQGVEETAAAAHSSAAAWAAPSAAALAQPATSEQQ